MGDGLVIGANGVTLDLGGHTIAGTGCSSSCGDEGPPGNARGVISLGHNDVTVKNGTITGFREAVSMGGTQEEQQEGMPPPPPPVLALRNRVLRLTLPLTESQSIAISFFLAKDGVIADDTITADPRADPLGWSGIFLDGTQVVVEHNRVTNISPGIVGGGDRNVLRSNTIEGDNDIRGERWEITGNTFTDLTLEVSQSTVAHNTVRGGGGLHFENPGAFFGNVAHHNVIAENLVWPGGIDIYGTHHNLVRGNEVGSIFAWYTKANQFLSNSLVPLGPPETGQVGGIMLFADGIGRADDNVIRGNVVRSAYSSGIIIDVSGSQGIRVVGNDVRRNADDGIQLSKPGVFVADNIANRNADFGIEAVPGTIDGGGNTAHGNGNPAECLNVRCR